MSPESSRCNTSSVDPDSSGPGHLDRTAIGVVALGGSVGSLARWALETTIPTRAGQLPWGTALINVTGSLLIGVVMVWCTERRPDDRWVRPFLAVGVLGGYTTFSTVMIESRSLLADGHPIVAMISMAGSVLAGVVAAGLGIVLARAWLPAHHDDGGAR